MSSSNYLQQLLAGLVSQLPVLLACVVAALITLNKWKQGSRGSLWAFLGFALAALLCVLIPLVQAGVQAWMMENPNVSQRTFIFAGLGLFWSILRAASYIFLLVAVFAGRPAAPVAPPIAAHVT